MARDYKHIARERPPRRSPPPWVWLLAGLAIGLLVAFLVYLSKHEPATGSVIGTQTVSSVDRPPAPRSTHGKENAGARAEEPTSSTKPRFEFYTILPEMEMHVPEHEVTTQPHSETPKPTAPATGTTYILQVGSFKRLAEADRLKAKLALIGLQASIQSVSIDREDTWHRVRLGPYQDLQALNDARERLREYRMEAIVLKDRY